ncbi:TIM barrel protein [Candidatus Saccharibacteria bacterium]|nr:TIM barrel protein [Candidatus Saccharibacteria bacterium]
MLGIHVQKGSSKTFEDAISRTHRQVAKFGLELGACQTFVSSPRSAFKDLSYSVSPELGPKHYYAHASHGTLMNQSTYSVNGIAHQLASCARMGMDGLVVHLYGTPKENIGATLASILASEKARTANAKVPILLEHVVSKDKNYLYTKPEDIGELLEYLKHKHPEANVGFCIDTCHMWANKTDISTPELAAAYIAGLRKHVPRAKYPLLAHLNDCEKPFGVALDRHAPLGKNIWSAPYKKSGLANFLTYFQEENIDYILERKPELLDEDLTVLQQCLT